MKHGLHALNLAALDLERLKQHERMRSPEHRGLRCAILQLEVTDPAFVIDERSGQHDAAFFVDRDVSPVAQPIVVEILAEAKLIRAPEPGDRVQISLNIVRRLGAILAAVAVVGELHASVPSLSCSVSKYPLAAAIICSREVRWALGSSSLNSGLLAISALTKGMPASCGRITSNSASLTAPLSTFSRSAYGDLVVVYSATPNTTTCRLCGSTNRNS